MTDYNNEVTQESGVHEGQKMLGDVSEADFQT